MESNFLNSACDILGATNEGLTTSDIIKITKDFAYEFNVEIPYFSMQIYTVKKCNNKRTALYENLLKFNEKQQYIILKNLCDNKKIKDNNKVNELKGKLIKKYEKKYPDEEENISNPVLSEHWLDKYPNALEKYEDAMIKYKHNIFDRNAIDDMRLSLELLIKQILKNEKSLENQKNELSNWLNKKYISQGMINMLISILKDYTTYNNNFVKHIKLQNNQMINKSELEFIIELTNVTMKFLIEIDKGE